MINKVYGRVEDNKVVEYPVYDLHIKNRNHPIEWYIECIIDDAPEVPPYHKLEEVVKYNTRANVITVGYLVKPMSLANLLNFVNKAGDGVKLFTPGIGEYVPNVEEEDPAAIQQCIKLIVEFVQKRLDTFAATRNYDGILSAASYKDSTIPSFAAEAMRAIELRDQTWAVLYIYLEEVNARTKPRPRSIEDIEKILPVLTW